ncbi:DDE-type integrase/transposase/recombinase [Micromonospora sp. NBC_00617]|uniref:DDE-type integrase/transposase/recombinase n=1 Tax=Micromonospora sp. NBC_00617 TaxID=2903587 RepID=UPI003869F9A2
MWRYVYRAAGQDGQLIDMFISGRRDAGEARRFFRWALSTGTEMGQHVSRSFNATAQLDILLRPLEP